MPLKGRKINLRGYVMINGSGTKEKKHTFYDVLDDDVSFRLRPVKCSHVTSLEGMRLLT